MAHSQLWLFRNGNGFKTASNNYVIIVISARRFSFWVRLFVSFFFCDNSKGNEQGLTKEKDDKNFVKDQDYILEKKTEESKVPCPMYFL